MTTSRARTIIGVALACAWLSGCQGEIKLEKSAVNAEAQIQSAGAAVEIESESIRVPPSAPIVLSVGKTENLKRGHTNVDDGLISGLRLHPNCPAIKSSCLVVRVTNTVNGYLRVDTKGTGADTLVRVRLSSNHSTSAVQDDIDGTNKESAMTDYPVATGVVYTVVAAYKSTVANPDLDKLLINLQLTEGYNCVKRCWSGQYTKVASCSH